MKILCIILFLPLTLVAGELFQIGTLPEFVDGKYSGNFRYINLMDKGINHGLGAPNFVDGETIITKAVIYEAKSSGKSYIVSKKKKTPFAWGVNFKSNSKEIIDQPTDFEDLKVKLKKQHIDSSFIYAIKIVGNFKNIKTRACPKVDGSPKLKDVLKTQKTFFHQNVWGNAIGYFFPKRLEHLNISGFHFHLLTKDLKGSGHILDNFKIKQAKIEIMKINKLNVITD